MEEELKKEKDRLNGWQEKLEKKEGDILALPPEHPDRGWRLQALASDKAALASDKAALASAWQALVQDKGRLQQEAAAAAAAAAAQAGQGQAFIPAPMMLSESAFRRCADVQSPDSLAWSGHAVALPEVAQPFREWARKNKQSCLDLLNSGDFADDKIPACRVEPDRIAYLAHGEIFRKLIQGVAKIDLGLSDEDWEKHPIRTLVTVAMDEAIRDMARLLLAFTAYKQLPPALVIKAAASQADRGGAPGGAAPLHHHMVPAGSTIEVTEVEVSQLQFAPSSPGSSSPMASSPASSSNPSSMPRSPSGGASSVSACSSSPSRDIASDAASRASASSRHAVQVDATLAERQLCGAQSLVLRGTSLTGPGKATPKNVVLRLLCGSMSGIAVTTSMQQWDREALSLRLLQGAGAPYLPSLEGCCVVTAGPPSVIGASALITARLGNPLHEHLAGGIAMHAHYVLLLAACLSAACYTLMAKALFHGDICPNNITASMDAHMRCGLFHLVDLGASCSAALNDPFFLGKYGYSASHDLSREAIVSDNAFSSLNALRAQPLLPCADLEAVVYTLVFLANGTLPWVSGPEHPETGRLRAMGEAAAWDPLATLPPPVASFAAWVLDNAMRETAPLEELRDRTASLFRAVHQELRLSLPWPAGIPGIP